MVRPRGDYSRVEEYLAEIEEQVEIEQGLPYSELEPDEQRQTLLEHFFRGIPQYEPAAEQMRLGLKGIVSSRTVHGYMHTRASTITLKGKTHHVVRDTITGRIRQWVRER